MGLFGSRCERTASSIKSKIRLKMLSFDLIYLVRGLASCDAGVEESRRIYFSLQTCEREGRDGRWYEYKRRCRNRNQ